MVRRAPHTGNVEVRRSIQRLGKDTDDSITSIESSITTIEGDIVVIQGDVATNAENIETIEENIATIQDDVATNTEDIGTIEDDVAGIEEDITSIEEDIASIEASVAANIFTSEAAEAIEAGQPIYLVVGTETAGIARADTPERSKAVGFANESAEEGVAFAWTAFGSLTLEAWPTFGVYVYGEITFDTFGSYDTSTKWQGAAEGNDNCVYCAPSSATTILRIDAYDDSVSGIGTVAGGSSKFDGAVANADGSAIYFVPRAASNAIKLTIATQTIEDIVVAWAYQWRTGALATNGVIYCAPYSTSYCLLIDTSDDSVSIEDSSIATGGTAKYHGAVASGDYIYFIPYSAESVLKVDTTTNTFTSHGALSSDANKWSGGVLADNGCIYCAPYNASTILKIDTSDDTTSEIGDFGTDGSKCSGGVMGGDGLIYFLPCSGDYLITIDPDTDETDTIEDPTSGSFYWWGGCIHNGMTIYCVPCKHTSGLKVELGAYSGEPPVAGTLYFLSDGGGMSSAPPDADGSSVVMVGYFISDTEFLVKITQPILL